MEIGFAEFRFSNHFERTHRHMSDEIIADRLREVRLYGVPFKAKIQNYYKQ